MNKQTILLIGGCGYIGCSLAQKWLNNGYKVTIIDNLYYNQGPLVSSIVLRPNCEFYNIDVEQTPDNVIKKSDILYLIHSYVGAPICSKLSEEEVKRVNIDSFRKILPKLSNNQRVIGLCTNSGYGSVDGICTEETPMKSLSLYGSTKEEQERILMQHPQSTSLRLATCWGRGEGRNRIDLMVNQFTYLLTCTNKLELFQGNYKRNFVNVQDVVDIMYHIALDKRTYREIYNLGQDQDNTTKEELAKIIAANFESPKISFSQNEDMDKRNYNCSSLKLAKLGHIATRTIKNNIKDLINFYKLFPKHGTIEHEKYVSLMKNY